MTAQNTPNRLERQYAGPFPWLSTRAKLLVVIGVTLVLTGSFVWASHRISSALDRCGCDRPAAIAD